MERRRTGPGAANQRRITALYDSLKKAGRRGTYLSQVLERVNERLAKDDEISSLSHLHFLLFGWPKGPRKVLVGGYLRNAIEPVPGMPSNVRFVRLRRGLKKRETMKRILGQRE